MTPRSPDRRRSRSPGRDHAVPPGLRARLGARAMRWAESTGRTVMHIIMVTPAPPRSRYGNRVTAVRWARILRRLGHRVTVQQDYQGERCDLLIALHARRSAAAAERYRRRYPDGPLVLALTGTDVYRDLPHSAEAQHSLERADALVTLQPLAAEAVPPALRHKVVTIYQSAEPVAPRPRPRARTFDVLVVGHLREEKDPFRTALAARDLPAQSRIRVLHVGKALSDDMERTALEEERRNPRYHWLGEQPHWRVRRLLGRSHVMVLSSRMEGGANVVAEAAVAFLPVLASRIPGTVGMLGEDYPGLFPPRDTAALRDLMWRAEQDGAFRGVLHERMVRLAPRFYPAQEREAWRRLLQLFGRPPPATERPAGAGPRSGAGVSEGER